jgi:hypothetical protein
MVLAKIKHYLKQVHKNKKYIFRCLSFFFFVNFEVR